MGHPFLQQNQINENSDDTAFPTHRFTNVNDELDYYKSHAETIELELAETKFALEEFQFSSKELEEELEKEIDSTERRYNEIKIRNEAMRQEVEEWKVCCRRTTISVFIYSHLNKQEGIEEKRKRGVRKERPKWEVHTQSVDHPTYAPSPRTSPGHIYQHSSNEQARICKQLTLFSLFL